MLGVSGMWGAGLGDVVDLFFLLQLGYSLVWSSYPKQVLHLSQPRFAHLESGEHVGPYILDAGGPRVCYTACRHGLGALLGLDSVPERPPSASATWYQVLLRGSW